MEHENIRLSHFCRALSPSLPLFLHYSTENSNFLNIILRAHASFNRKVYAFRCVRSELHGVNEEKLSDLCVAVAIVVTSLHMALFVRCIRFSHAKDSDAYLEQP